MPVYDDSVGTIKSSYLAVATRLAAHLWKDLKCYLYLYFK